MSNFVQKTAPWSYIILGVIAYGILMLVIMSGKNCGASNEGRRNRETTDASTNSKTESDKTRIIEVPKEAPQELTLIRPLNGQSLTKKDPEKGIGEIDITNNGADDAIIKLVDVETGKTYRHSYVHAGRVLELKSIKSGSYWIKFSTGRDYAVEKNGFTVDANYMMFETATTFTTEIRGDRQMFTTLSIVLFPSKGGNVNARIISEEEFADKE